MMHIHRWSNWQDVKLGDEVKFSPPLMIYRQTITQQRRCSVCNMVKTRTT